MTRPRQADLRDAPDRAVDSCGDVLEIRLDESGRSSWRSAVFSAVIAAAGGPLFRFVAAPVDTARDPDEHAAAGARFPVLPFHDLDDRTEQAEWIDLAEERLDELDAELQAAGWRRRPERGEHWWSLRYDRPF